MGRNYYLKLGKGKERQFYHLCKFSAGWPVMWDLDGIRKAYFAIMQMKLSYHINGTTIKFADDFPFIIEALLDNYTIKDEEHIVINKNNFKVKVDYHNHLFSKLPIPETELHETVKCQTNQDNHWLILTEFS